jgi:hypothetical protein
MHHIFTFSWSFENNSSSGNSFVALSENFLTILNQHLTQGLCKTRDDSTKKLIIVLNCQNITELAFPHSLSLPPS